MRFDKMLVFSIAMLGLAWGSIAPTLAEPQVELVHSRLPGRDSTAYQSLTETAGAHSVEILATSAAELWSIPQARVAAVTDKAVALGIGVSRVGPTWNRVLLPLSARAQMTDGQKSMKHLPGLELRFSRGSGPELAEHLKKGVADVAVGGPLGETWDRLDNWTLFTEPYRLVIGSAHALASRSSVSAAELNKEHLLQRTFCEHNAELCAFLAESGAPSYPPHQVGSERDALALLASNIGACIMPERSVVSEEVRRVDIDGFSLMRPVCVYAVSGRQRSVAANTFIKMLRSADWTEHSHRPQRQSA